MSQIQPDRRSQTVETPTEKLNVLALVAMIVAIVGFIFACMPCAFIIGWILLPIALVLSVFSLFFKGNKTWFGIIGLVLSIIGASVGYIVFAMSAVATDDALGEQKTIFTQLFGNGADSPASGKLGTRDNPYPLGSQISSSDWTVTINSVNPDGNSVVAEAESYNRPAPAGSHYEIINYTLTYTGDKSAQAADVSVAVVTSSHTVVHTYNSVVVLKDRFGLDEIDRDSSVTGSEPYVIPDGDTYLIRVRPGPLAEEVFIKP